MELSVELALPTAARSLIMRRELNALPSKIKKKKKKENCLDLDVCLSVCQSEI
jgi:hypothetical protein